MKITMIPKQKEEIVLHRKNPVDELLDEAEVRARTERESHEKIRAQMVGGKNLLIFAVEKIIDKTVLSGTERIEMHFSDELGFPEDRAHLTLATDLFQRMTECGCFIHVEQHSGWFVCTKPDLSKIQSFKRILKKELKDGEKSGEFYIMKEGDDFHYKGNLLTLLRNNDWYKVFSALYDLIPEGGEITYAKLGGQIRSKIRKTKSYSTKTMIKFFQTNLTDKSNGFMHYANIPENEDNGKPLLRVNRGKSIIFNNKPG